MTRNHFAGLLAILLASSASLAQDASTSKVNFVFFLVDDLGWTDAGC